MKYGHAASIEVTLTLLFNDLRHAIQATTDELRDAEYDAAMEDETPDAVYLLRRELALLDVTEEAASQLRAFLQDHYIEKEDEKLGT